MSGSHSNNGSAVTNRTTDTERIKQDRADALAAPHDVICFLSQEVNATEVANKLPAKLRLHMLSYALSLAESHDVALQSAGKSLLSVENGVQHLHDGLGLTVTARPIPMLPHMLSVSVSIAIPGMWPIVRFGVSLFDFTRAGLGIVKCVLPKHFVALLAPCTTYYSIPAAMRSHRQFTTNIFSFGNDNNLTVHKLLVPMPAEDLLAVFVTDPAKLCTAPLVFRMHQHLPLTEHAILPTPHDTHAYFLFGDLHFLGLRIESAPTAHLVSRYASLLTSLGLPAPIHAVAVGRSVMRVYFATTKHKDAVLAYKESAGARPGWFTVPDCGPLAVLSQHVRLCQCGLYFCPRPSFAISLALTYVNSRVFLPHSA